jgi:hypothetical protein
VPTSATMPPASAASTTCRSARGASRWSPASSAPD